MKSQNVLLARLVRRWFRRWEAHLHWKRFSFSGVPRLFANSFPKSGTHLLTQVLHGFTRLGPAVDSGLPAIVTFDGFSGRERSTADILTDLQRLLPGDITYGHLHATPEIVNLLCQPEYAAFFILRDPRDVVVSHVYYITEIETNHIHHEYYTKELHDFDQRLRTSIIGLPDERIPFPDIHQRFAPFMGWLEHSEVLTLRFEDFIQDREHTLGMVFDHGVERGFPTAYNRPRAIAILAEGIDPGRSPTYRSGKAGSWRTQFSAQNKDLFKDVAGDLLIRLGYERDHNW